MFNIRSTIKKDPERLLSLVLEQLLLHDVIVDDVKGVDHPAKVVRQKFFFASKIQDFLCQFHFVFLVQLKRMVVEKYSFLVGGGGDV